MKFHPNKCKILSLSYKHQQSWKTFNYMNDNVSTVETFTFPFYDKFPYCLGDNCLDYVKSEKDLGVHVNYKLKWSEQCKAIISKANSKLGLIKRTCAFTNTSSQRRILYLSLVRSQFEHCSVIWRPVDIEFMNKIEALQKRAIKWILFEQFEHYSEQDYLNKLHKLDLLPMNVKFVFTDLLLFHKIVYNNICIKMPDHIVLSNISEHGRSSRSNADNTSDFLKYKSIERPKIAAFSNSFFYRSIIEWNKLPLDIREICSHDIFKDNLKSHLWTILKAKPD